MMFSKAVLTFLITAALLVNVLAAPTSLTARAKGEEEQQEIRQLIQESASKAKEAKLRLEQTLEEAKNKRQQLVQELVQKVLEDKLRLEQALEEANNNHQQLVQELVQRVKDNQLRLEQALENAKNPPLPPQPQDPHQPPSLPPQGQSPTPAQLPGYLSSIEEWDRHVEAAHEQSPSGRS